MPHSMLKTTRTKVKNHSAFTTQIQEISLKLSL